MNAKIAQKITDIAKTIVATEQEEDEAKEITMLLSKIKPKLSKLLSQFSKVLPDIPTAMKKMTAGNIIDILYTIGTKGDDGEDIKEKMRTMPQIILKLKKKTDKILSIYSNVLPDIPQVMKKMTIGDLFQILHAVATNEPEEINETSGQKEKKTASVKIAGEVASKDGKYGKKGEGWDGTINYNGTKGIVSNAVFELKNGRIVWTDGTWHSGTWAYGLWKDGLWKEGTWQMGEWENGIWMSGTWVYGTWYYGIWKQDEDDRTKKSVWMNGTWKNGIWENGTHESGWWEKGIWQNGVWNGGTMWNGTWNNGVWNNGLNWYGEWHDGIWNKGQWNEGVWLGGTWKGGFDKKKNWHPEGASPNKWKNSGVNAVK